MCILLGPQARIERPGELSIPSSEATVFAASFVLIPQDTQNRFLFLFYSIACLVFGSYGLRAQGLGQEGSEKAMGMGFWASQHCANWTTLARKMFNVHRRYLAEDGINRTSSLLHIRISLNHLSNRDIRSTPVAKSTIFPWTLTR